MMSANKQGIFLRKFGCVTSFLLATSMCVCFALLWISKTQLSGRIFPAKISTVNVHDFRKAISLDDILMTVKTTCAYHSSRVELITKTWFKYASRQTYFITDCRDAVYQRKTGRHMVVTNCSATHSREDLCCKLEGEYETFQTTKKKWWCHVDDDNYVNVDLLVDLLNNFDWRDQIYLGRRSVNFEFRTKYQGQKYLYNFATGGAGICVSRPLAARMSKHFGNGRFPDLCNKSILADDTGLGFVMTSLLNVNLTASKLLNSHGAGMLKNIAPENVTKQATLSYKGRNVIRLNKDDVRFPEDMDPTRLMSLHCMLYPKDDLCEKT